MRGRGRFGPLTERPFRLLWLGRTGSSIGDSLIPVALAFAVLRIGGGATGLGIVLAAFTIGRAAFVVVGGVWADRLPRRAVMITADLVRFCTQAVTAALLLGHVAQSGNTLWETALQQEVRPDRLARVGSIDWLLSLCLMPAGQALAGPLVGPLGVRGTLILAAAPMSVPNLCVLGFVREVRRVRRRDAPDPAPA